MQWYKLRFTLFVVTLLLAVSACGEGAMSSGEGQFDSLSEAHFFHLAVVPNQTVSTSTFEVQAIAEMLNPNAGTLVSPQVIDGRGDSHVMVQKVLKWPGTVEDSVTIWSVTIPLVTDQVNNVTVVSGAKQIAFSVRHKTALTVTTVANATLLRNAIQAAITNPNTDVIEVAYNEPDLGSAINNVGNGITNARSTWLTIRPATGNTISWVRDSGAPYGRPMVDFLHLSTVTFGSDTSDGGGGMYYVEPNHRVWLSEMQFRGKYKLAWSVNTPVTADYQSDVRTSVTEGQKVYFTDCLWDGSASTAATSYAQLARDLRFNSVRGDLNNFGKVVLNLYGQDIVPVRNVANTDFLHNDGFQIWGNAGTTDLIVKGLKIISPNVPANIQPFLLDSTFTPNYQNVMLDSFLIVGAAPGTILQAQLAGRTTNSRFSNISFASQNMTFRYDLGFNPAGVYISNIQVYKILYVPVVGTSVAYDYQNVSNTNNISSELSANAALSGITFSNIMVSSGP